MGTKVLIVGAGIIGTIYGWALKAAGVDVIHLVRKGKVTNYEGGVPIDILDERKGFTKHNKTTYPIETIDRINPEVTFDLVIVPTNWCQTQDALKSVAPKCPNSFFYILTSNWTGTQTFDVLLNKSQYILGYPDGGGTNRDGTYWTNIGPEIHIATPTEENKQGFDAVKTVFDTAHIKLDVQENMLHWLWVHNAGSIPMMAALQKYKNIKESLADKNLLKKSFLATRECLALCEKRAQTQRNTPKSPPSTGLCGF